MTLPGPLLPGQTPIDDLSGLKDRSITTQAELNALEAENIRKATVKYLAAKPSRRSARFDLAWALKLHKEMFGDVWEWGGRVRTTELNMGSPAYQVSVQLQTLLDDLRAWNEAGMPLIEQAVRLHHRAVAIHPFLNGNGRWSRMLGNIWLKLNGVEPVEWPESTLGAESTVRNEYIAAIRRADDHDYGPLIALHERFQTGASAE